MQFDWPSLGRYRALFAGAAVILLGTMGRSLLPHFEVDYLARFAAQGAAWFLGTPLSRIPEGWAMLHMRVPAVVSAACSGADYALLTGALITWHVARRKQTMTAIGLGFLLGIPFAIGVNALRVVAVIQLYRWVIPRVAPAYENFLHLLTGTAVFLPGMMVLHGLFHFYETRFRASSPARV